MPIAPITGSLKRRAATDLVIGLALGTLGGSWYWWSFHKGVVSKREDYYQQLAAAKQAEDA
ncbi:cytochrome c oxidase subunit VIIa [Saccharomycopsis crataegensis]|uniref:Cytochrome c oxidase subunit 9, mitochondrial n=1 Tax=Saccharomycopsis crataegensis TaxID=43959 RepID=A0AAV5QHJ1_9ASCO|nr:cytochrome c oxidase subunit VIIa [Saccharomycopsis crataegensis]